MIGNKKPSYKGGFSVNLLLTWDILPLLVCTPLCFVRRSTRIQKTAHKDGFSVNSPLVRMKGLEPSRPEALAPKASVSTNSTTSAYCRICILFVGELTTCIVPKTWCCIYGLLEQIQALNCMNCWYIPTPSPPPLVPPPASSRIEVKPRVYTR